MFYVTSDLHYGVSCEGDAAVRQLARFVACATPGDVLLLGGDLATTDEQLRACLALFRDFPGIKAAIAGNHDVWVEPASDGNSWDRYRRFSEHCRAAGFHPLEEEPLVVGGIGIAGAMGWYDYSFRDDIGIPLKTYEQKSCPELGVTWSDTLFVRWPYTDREMTEAQVARLAQHLDQIRNVRESLVLLHHVPTKRLLFHPRDLVPKDWRFANAFLGSERFAETIARYSHIQHVVNGHVHSENQIRICGATFTSIGGSYEAKQLLRIRGSAVSRQNFSGV